MADYGYLLPTRGIVLSSDDRETLAAKTQADAVGFAERAEAVGFRSVWIGDSILAKPRLEPLTTLSAVAQATTGVELGTAVYLPALRHPIHVAHQTATLDQLSGGRLKLGVGVGIGPDVEAEHENLGIPYSERGPRLAELLEILDDLWAGETVTHDGRFYNLEDASIGFGPVGTPSIYVPTAAFDPTEGFPASLSRRLVNHGDGWLPIGLQPDEYADGLDVVRGILSEGGRDPASIDPGIYLDVVIADDEATALDQARIFYDQYYPAWDELSDAEIRERGAFGPPAEVAATLAEFEAAGAETIVCRFTTPNQREQLSRFDDVR